ncbi:hypothetical protein H6P81_020993 [Aristolochia fimbriata]|uniref:Neprosin activation peptide domain-containing protein n=1 Tax=Aristolochia fimbriata TaxID=158543 RepID=A0AAV7DW52_ARIFI|nr:hypothetical protein H6P81_020993 [Aristolochia fimbriata]
MAAAGARGLGAIELGIACLAISVLFGDVSCVPGGTRGKKTTFTKEDYLQMESQLEYVKSVAVKTFQTEHGDIIDCVPFEKQPSLQHPALKGHVAQKAPSFVAEGLVKKFEQPTGTEPGKQPSKTETETQSCSVVGAAKRETVFARFPDEGCPEGTVPIVRPGNLDSLRKQYAAEGEGSAEGTQVKGESSATEARDEGDHHDEIGKVTTTNFELNTVLISELNPQISEKQFLHYSQGFSSAPKDQLDTVGWEASGYKTNDWSRLDGNRFGQANRKLSPGGILEAFSTFKSLLY